MSTKGTITKADYIEFDMAQNVGLKLLKSNNKKVYGLYIIVAINTGLRISDLLQLKWEDIRQEKIIINEKKTGKRREIIINDNIKSVLKFFDNTEGYIFISQKSSVISIQQINRELKIIFHQLAKKHNISSHSLRKSFGRRVYLNNNESEKALVYLSELFNHSSLAITRKYLGIRQEELDNIYLNL